MMVADLCIYILYRSMAGGGGGGGEKDSFLYKVLQSGCRFVAWWDWRVGLVGGFGAGPDDK